ncbi:MAG: hypothetical protein WCI97_05540, partial [Bacteroidota bacterium]
CAFFRPFETFLFAYAFFGPAHYLTEISWLHDRNYFTKGKFDWIWLLLAGVIITLANFRLVPNLPDSASTIIIFVAFMSALVFVLVKNTITRIALIVFIAFISKFLVGFGFFESLFGVFMPTLIHVFIFTGLFILVGALKGRNLSGILSLVFFIGIAISFFYLPISNGHYTPTNYVMDSYGHLKNDGSFSDGFISLNYHIMSVFNLHDFGKPTVDLQQFIDGFNNFLFENPLSLSIMAFIGFAYLYHYLNWFSKTSVIQWHNIPRSRFIGIIVLWILSEGLYAIDYAVGLQWLFFLSFTHVLLEFPLNQLTFINIGKEIGGIFSEKKPSGKTAKA